MVAGRVCLRIWLGSSWGLSDRQEVVVSWRTWTFGMATMRTRMLLLLLPNSNEWLRLPIAVGFEHRRPRRTRLILLPTDAGDWHYYFFDANAIADP